MQRLTKQFMVLLGADVLILATLLYMVLPAAFQANLSAVTILGGACALVVLADIIFGVLKFKRLTR
jgi:hypothetical protein